MIKTDMITVEGIEPGMIANNLTPFKPTHPGSLLKEELECRNISQTRFSKKLKLPNSAFNEILNGKRPITTDFALLMEASLNIPAYLLIGLQTDYNLHVAKNDKKLVERLAEVRQFASVF
jgi:addiction module HigA family antidote